MPLHNWCNIRSYPRVMRAFLIMIVLAPRILPGITLGYSAIALPQLEVTIDEASCFSSLVLLGGPIGFVISSLLTDQVGRKLSLICSVVPSVIGWYLLTSDFSSGRTYIGRFLTGLSTGSSACASSKYLGETFMLRTDKFGSRFVTWSATASAFGTCFVYTFGAMFTYKEVAAICLALSCVFIFLTVYFIPESPVWLYRNSRFGDADWSRLYLGLQFADSDFLSFETASLETNLRFNLSLKSIQQLFSTPEIRKAIIVTTVLLTFSMLSGGLTLSTYMVNAIETRTFFKNSYLFASVSGMLQLFVSGSISSILPYSGGRKLTLISGSGLALGMFIIALTTQVKYEPDFHYQKFIDRLHTLAVWFSISMFSLGFLTLPTRLLGEVFPRELQASACLIPITVSFVTNLVVIKMHLYWFRNYGGILYIFYALMNVLGTYFVWILMPETTSSGSSSKRRENREGENTTP